MRPRALSAVLFLTTACTFGETSCIAEGAVVDTPDGPRAIETLAVGDRVWAVDTRTGERVSTRIVGIRTATRECLALELPDGGSLVCTPDHPVYDPDSEHYVPAVRWLERQATRILRVDDRGVRIERVVSVRTGVGVRRVFDLTVESELHDFVASGVLVHNKSPIYCTPGDDPYCTDETTSPDDATTATGTGSSGGTDTQGDTTTSTAASSDETGASSDDTSSGSEETGASSDDTGSSSEETAASADDTGSGSSDSSSSGA
jgi:Hint domain